MENAIFQQIDIMPTVLDLLDIDTKYYSFGNSYFSKSPREGVAYLEGTYFYFYDNYVLYFSNDKSKRLVKFNTWEINPRNELNEKKKLVKFMERRLKAIIQRYNNDLLSNSAKAP
jgi:phosphoglycerol transferase MdoB-like AlkP superfamily enzyme